MVVSDFYTNDMYIKKNPGWHVGSSPWKAAGILRMIRRHALQLQTVCEIGCGAGEILRILQQELDPDCTFVGYDIAPQAIDLAKARENAQLHFHRADFAQQDTVSFDLILMIDVLEHIENCFQFLRDIRPKSQYKMFLLPLDISAAAVVRNELIDYRHATGHLHFFTKDIAIEVIQEAGYEILDAFYLLPPLDPSPWSLHPLRCLRKVIRLTKRGLQRFPGHMLYTFHRDLAVRLFGGWKLMVLVREKDNRVARA